jgi:hypothetical protein
VRAPADKRLAKLKDFHHYSRVTRISPMSRSRAIAIAAEQKAHQGRMMLAAGLLLLPAALLLLLISP